MTKETEAAALPAFEQTMEGELEKAKRLSTNGGVLVASVPGAGGIPDAHVLSVVIQTVRNELRSSDLLGQLAGGDIAAVLVRTSPDGVATAASRVRQRLDALARERQVPPVVVGHALYPHGGMESPAALIARARREAGLLYS
jgi:GGDEF domain-containing protein